MLRCDPRTSISRGDRLGRDRHMRCEDTTVWNPMDVLLAITASSPLIRPRIGLEEAPLDER
jgi:hypothetical protein